MRKPAALQLTPDVAQQRTYAAPLVTLEHTLEATPAERPDVNDAPAVMAGPNGCAVTVVEAHGGAILAKRWYADGTGKPYDNARTVTLHAVPVSDLAGLHSLLRDLLQAPRCCIVRGEPIDPARVAHVRRLLHRCPATGDGPTLREVPRRWVAVDVDGLPLPAAVDPRDLAACALVVRPALPHAFQDAAAIVGATASHGMKPGARLRWWAWLSRPTTSAELETWFAGRPVDLCTFRPVQLIYTAAPLFVPGLADPLPERLVLVPGAREVVPVPAPAMLRPAPRMLPAQRRKHERDGGAGALDYARRTIAAAHESTRHDTAKRMAAFLGHLARDGEVSADAAKRAIADGIEAAGKQRAEGEAVATWALDRLGGAA